MLPSLWYPLSRGGCHNPHIFEGWKRNRREAVAALKITFCLYLYWIKIHAEGWGLYHI